MCCQHINAPPSEGPSTAAGCQDHAAWNDEPAGQLFLKAMGTNGSDHADIGVLHWPTNDCADAATVKTKDLGSDGDGKLLARGTVQLQFDMQKAGRWELEETDLDFMEGWMQGCPRVRRSSGESNAFGDINCWVLSRGAKFGNFAS